MITHKQSFMDANSFVIESPSEMYNSNFKNRSNTFFENSKNFVVGSYIPNESLLQNNFVTSTDREIKFYGSQMNENINLDTRNNKTKTSKMNKPVEKNLLDQFHKTKMCIAFFNSSCKRGETCCFAHGTEELKVPVNLIKTKICKKYEIGMCNDSNCSFAHGAQELKCTDDYFKTGMCKYWKRGFPCEAGDLCRHAHGEHELRPRVYRRTERDKLDLQKHPNIQNSGTVSRTSSHPSLCALLRSGQPSNTKQLDSIHTIPLNSPTSNNSTTYLNTTPLQRMPIAIGVTSTPSFCASNDNSQMPLSESTSFPVIQYVPEDLSTGENNNINIDKSDNKIKNNNVNKNVNQNNLYDISCAEDTQIPDNTKSIGGRRSSLRCSDWNDFLHLRPIPSAPSILMGYETSSNRRSSYHDSSDTSNDVENFLIIETVPEKTEKDNTDGLQLVEIDGKRVYAKISIGELHNTGRETNFESVKKISQTDIQTNTENVQETAQTIDGFCSNISDCQNSNIVNYNVSPAVDDINGHQLNQLDSRFPFLSSVSYTDDEAFDVVSSLQLFIQSTQNDQNFSDRLKLSLENETFKRPISRNFSSPSMIDITRVSSQLRDSMNPYYLQAELALQDKVVEMCENRSSLNNQFRRSPSESFEYKNNH